MIQGLKRLKTEEFKDGRGIITEIFKSFPVKSVTHTVSLPQTLRGIHVQGWDKIIYVATGLVYAGFYDDRKKSKTYQEIEQIVIEPGQAYFIPKGVGNSFLVVGTQAVNYFYFNKENYDSKKMYGISYKKMTWPLGKKIMSKKDKAL